MDTMNNNRSPIDLCFKNMEETVLAKSDTQEKLDMLVENSEGDTGDNCKLYNKLYK